MKTRTFLTIGTLVATLGTAAAAGSIENVVLGSASDKPLRLDVAPGPATANLLDGARIGVTGTTGRLDLGGSELAALDGNKRSSLQFDADGQTALELHFYGAPRFINTIEIETDAQDLTV